MAIWDTIKGQLRTVIEWEDASQDTLFELWSANGDEIKDASKLILKPGQGVIFIYEGQIQAVHEDEGMYELRTANVPFITTLSKYMQAFESEHKVGLYFFWRTEIVDQKWGTRAPVKYDDPVYKFPVGLRAHGNFSFKITQPEYFFTNIVGGRNQFSVNDARTIIANRFIQQLTDVLAESGFSYSEIDKNRVELAELLTQEVEKDLTTLGFTLTDFRIEGTDFDAETKTRIDRIANATAEAIAAEKVGLSYDRMQQLEALRDAAKNEGGAAGAGVGIGAGVGLGQAMAGGMFSQPQQTAPSAPQSSSGDHTERLMKLKSLFDSELISKEEYEKKKSAILDEL